MKKWALIIGGSSGMGLATAQKLAKHDFNLVIIHRDRRSVLEGFEGHVEKIKATGSEVLTFNRDATNPEKISEIIGQLPSEINFHLVLHAVSRGNLKPFLAFTDADKSLTTSDIQLTLEAMSVNVHTWVSRLMERKLIAKKGRVVTLTSAGSQRYWDGYGAVAMAKSSLEILTKYLAVELAKADIRANVINAGITDTPSLRFIPGYEQLIKGASERNPFGRMTTPADVANVVYLLTLSEADWINGTVIDVDGGEHLMG